MKTLSELTTGDEVLMWHNGCWDTRMLVHVTETTETLIKVNGYRFRKSDGCEPGTHRPDHIKVPTDEDREELARDLEERQLLRFILKINWRGKDLETLRAVRNLFPL